MAGKIHFPAKYTPGSHSGAWLWNNALLSDVQSQFKYPSLVRGFQERMPDSSVPKDQLQLAELDRSLTYWNLLMGSILTCCVKRRSSSGTGGYSYCLDTPGPGRNPRWCSLWRTGMSGAMQERGEQWEWGWSQTFPHLQTYLMCFWEVWVTHHSSSPQMPKTNSWLSESLLGVQTLDSVLETTLIQSNIM